MGLSRRTLPPGTTQKYNLSCPFTPRASIQLDGHAVKSVCVLRWYETVATAVDYRQSIDGTRLAGLEQFIPRHGLRGRKHGDSVLIEYERLGAFADTVAETDAQCPVNPDNEVMNSAFDIGRHHISSRPRSTRAWSITSGVMTWIPRSEAHSE